MKVECSAFLDEELLLFLLGETAGEGRVCLLMLTSKKGRVLTSISCPLLLNIPSWIRNPQNEFPFIVFKKENACWTLTTPLTIARDPRFIILLSRVLYKSPLKTVSSSILIIPWCCAHLVLVKMPSHIWAHFSLNFCWKLSKCSALCYVLGMSKGLCHSPLLRVEALRCPRLLEQTRYEHHFVQVVYLTVTSRLNYPQLPWPLFSSINFLICTFP